MELISDDGINPAARVTGGVLLKRDCNCWIIWFVRLLIGGLLIIELSINWG